MLKAVLVATTAFALAGSTVAYAQRDGRPDGARPEAGRRAQTNADDVRAFQAARLAALRAGLALNAEQERLWPPFEQAMRDLQQLRLNRTTTGKPEARDDQAQDQAQDQGPNPAERMRLRATRLSEDGAALKRLADAMDPLYRSLDEGQKRRFAILSRMEGKRNVGFSKQRRGEGEEGKVRAQRKTEAPEDDAAGVENGAGKLRGGFGKTVDSEPGFGRKVVVLQEI